MLKYKDIELAVEEFTTPNPIFASEDLGIDELIQIMKDNQIRHLPIVRENTVVGILSQRNLRLVEGLNITEKSLLTAKDVMVPDPETVYSQDPLDEVALKMSQNKIGSVIVLDENQELLGIFTATDALNALVEIARSLRNDN